MNIKIITQLAAIFLLLSPLAAQAGTMSSPTYSSESGSTLAGAGSASSPGYSSRAGAVGNAFAVPPGSTSPSYTLYPAIPAKMDAGIITSTLPTGDVNSDGSVTIADALLALQISVGSVAVTKAHLKNGDVAPFVDLKPVPDGAITVADALIILRKVVGLVSW